MAGISTESTLFSVFNIITFFSLVGSGGIINIVRFYNDQYLWSQVKKMFLEFRKKPRRNIFENKKIVEKSGLEED